MDDLKQTADERAQILKQREQRDRRRWIVEGMFLIADHIESVGNECAGGAGVATNPATGQRYGEPYYTAADEARRRAAFLSANPERINV